MKSVASSETLLRHRGTYGFTWTSQWINLPSFAVPEPRESLKHLVPSSTSTAFFTNHVLIEIAARHTNETLYTASGPALGPIQPHIQWAPGVFTSV